MPTPNLLNPGNDPRVEDAIRRGLLGLAAGIPGQYGDLGQLLANTTGGLLGAQVNALDPSGRVQAMAGQPSGVPQVQMPYTSNEFIGLLGGDPSDPVTQAGTYLSPGIEDLVPGGKAVGGLLASAPIIGKFGKKGAKGGKKSKIGGLLDKEDPPLTKLSPMADEKTAKEVLEKDIWSTDPAKSEERTRDAIFEHAEWEAKQRGFRDRQHKVEIDTIAERETEAFYSDPDRLKAALDGDVEAIRGTDYGTHSIIDGELVWQPYEGILDPWRRNTPEELAAAKKEGGYRAYYQLREKDKGHIDDGVIWALIQKQKETDADGMGLLSSKVRGEGRREAYEAQLQAMSRPELKAEIDRVFNTGPTSERAARRGMSVVDDTPTSGGLLGGTRVADDVPLQDTVRATLAEDATALGFKKVKKTGAYVGAPPGVKGDDDIVRLAEEYAERVERALDAGVDKDYFYLKGQRAIEGVTDDATTAKQLAEANAITSSEAPVRNNYGWATQAFEQRAAGMPVRTGKYPVEASDKIETVFKGGEPHLGEKRHLYGQGLSGEGRKLPEELRNAPNDRWEIRGFGYDKDSAGPAQHKFMHGVRRIAKDIVNERLGTDLDIYNVQELNWATTRADSMGISIPESATDTIQAAIPQYRFQHSWETVPGKNLLDVDMPAHDKALRDIYLDEGGKDKLIRNFGGELQEPALQNVPGVFEGNVNPYGYQSRSQAYHAGGKLADSSTDRIKATETTRSFMNLQDAAAGSLITPSKRKTVKPFGGALRFDLGRPINQDEAQQVVDTLRKYHGINDFGVVPNAGGADILATGAKGLEKQGEELHGLLGSQGVMSDFSGTGFYAELPWDERKATETMLESMTPAMRNRADSDEMRVMAGQLYDYYKGLPNDPPKGFREVLKTWATDGIDGVQDLVKKGLAPAGVLGILVGAQLKQEETDHGLL